MDVTGLLCVSLGSSTVQLHGSVGSWRACACSEAGFGIQNGDGAWGCTTEEQRSVVRFFCGQKDSMQRIFIKIYFLFTVGSVCRLRRFTTGWQTFRWWRRGWNGDAEVAETTDKRLLRCGFRRTGKAMGQVEDMSRNIFFQVRISLYILYQFVTYLLTLPRTYCGYPTSRSMFLMRTYHFNITSHSCHAKFTTEILHFPLFVLQFRLLIAWIVYQKKNAYFWVITPCN
jgi:hypothetical protein